MIVLLPPSETKRPGGSGAPLELSSLALPELRDARQAAVDALVALSAHPDEAARVLKLSDRQRGEIAVNAGVYDSGTMAAIDRFTGVLFDALDASSLDTGAREWLGKHAFVQTALLGPVAADDLIPAFRLSGGGRLPGLPALKRHWAEATTSAWASAEVGLVVDLRSEVYRALGPVPENSAQTYVRVVAETGDGSVRALNHFNKKTKGLLVRALAQASVVAESVDALRAAASEVGFEMRHGDVPGETLLVASE
ncbi:YaaA family protein [Microbacterium amylolyticum]|uniref:Cytoplasmic iron level regulating protein YaaA (DUF328/UPF0246 family) n=1 Tax=Microbacterium amylolyticum TaxID=936337 RepID=A0ABS4ZG37_9MICO|nr:peroxide stress protein YaaA [Microbacterium amylolyticum]MBP2436236.1 cytoplasmic iron level regulating protein YaaA (DUF328/UPF0246 family) [Microbacterium amylolyticum]